MYIEKVYNQSKDHERYKEEVLIDKAVKTTIQILYDKGFLDDYDTADEVLGGYLLFDEVNEKRSSNLEEANDIDVI